MSYSGFISTLDSSDHISYRTVRRGNFDMRGNYPDTAKWGQKLKFGKKNRTRQVKIFYFLSKKYRFSVLKNSVQVTPEVSKLPRLTVAEQV